VCEGRQKRIRLPSAAGPSSSRIHRLSPIFAVVRLPCFAADDDVSLLLLLLLLLLMMMCRCCC
jgi:hypothetical protein